MSDHPIIDDEVVFESALQHFTDFDLADGHLEQLTGRLLEGPVPAYDLSNEVDLTVPEVESFLDWALAQGMLVCRTAPNGTRHFAVNEQFFREAADDVPPRPARDRRADDEKQARRNRFMGWGLAALIVVDVVALLSISLLGQLGWNVSAGGETSLLLLAVSAVAYFVAIFIHSIYLDLRGV